MEADAAGLSASFGSLLLIYLAAQFFIPGIFALIIFKLLRWIQGSDHDLPN